MNIIAVIGSESHTTSRGWSKLSINGRPMFHREALSAEWKTKFGDKHASWCECVFIVKPGDRIRWEAGSNAGARGADRRRLNLEFVADEKAEILETEDLGYPAVGAVLRGRMRLAADAIADAAAMHEQIKSQL